MILYWGDARSFRFLPARVSWPPIYMHDTAEVLYTARVHFASCGFFEKLYTTRAQYRYRLKIVVLFRAAVSSQRRVTHIILYIQQSIGIAWYTQYVVTGNHYIFVIYYIVTHHVCGARLRSKLKNILIAIMYRQTHLYNYIIRLIRYKDVYNMFIFYTYIHTSFSREMHKPSRNVNNIIYILT